MVVTLKSCDRSVVCFYLMFSWFYGSGYIVKASKCILKDYYDEQNVQKS